MDEDDELKEIIVVDEPYNLNCQRFYRLPLLNGVFHISQQDKDNIVNGFNHGINYWNLNVVGFAEVGKGETYHTISEYYNKNEPILILLHLVYFRLM